MGAFLSLFPLCFNCLLEALWLVLNQQQHEADEEEEERKTAVGASDASLTWSSSIFFMAALLVPPTTSLSNTLYQLPITGPFIANQTKQSRLMTLLINMIFLETSPEKDTS